MTIASLFVKLGFISETDDIDKVDKQIKLAESSARKLALGIGLIDTAMIVLMKGMLGVVVGMTKFRVETGLSTDQLQRWQYAAKLSNVAASDVTGAIMSIQDAQAGIALGEGNIAPWQLLGIDPRQNPIDVLDQIADRIKNLDPGVARHITSQMGISNDMFFLLKQVADGKMKLEDFNKIALVTPEQEADMMRLNREWQDFTWQIERASIAVAAKLQPAFSALIPVAKEMIAHLLSFINRMKDGGDLQKYSAWIKNIAEALLVLGPLLTGIIATMAALNTVVGVAGNITAIAALTAQFALLAASIAAVVAVWHDLSVLQDAENADHIGAASGAAADTADQKLHDAMHAKKGFVPKTDEQKRIYNLNPVAVALDSEQPKSFFDLSQDPTPRRLLPAAAHSAIVPPMVARQAAAAAKQEASAAAPAAKPSVTVNQNVDVHVNGAQDPAATGAAVADAIQKARVKELSGVSDQMALAAQGY